jgi:hypothetical protein
LLAGWGLSEFKDAAEAVVSELVTNAIRASCPEFGRLAQVRPDAGETVSLTLSLLPGRVVIEVFDNDPSPPVRADVGPESESGRGLVIVDMLSSEWGYRYPPSGGKVVFAILDIGDRADALWRCNGHDRRGSARDQAMRTER